MRRISLLFSIALFFFSFVILFSCSSGGGSDPAPDPQVNITNFAFIKGNIYTFQQTDGVSNNLISRIYYNGESWKREVVLKDLPFIIYDMAVDTKNNWLYIVASDKAIYRVKPVAGGKLELVTKIPSYNPSSTRITINNKDGMLYLGGTVSSYINVIKTVGDGTVPSFVIPGDEKCIDLDYDDVKNSLYYITSEGNVYCKPTSNDGFKVTQVIFGSENVQVYPGNTFPNNGLYFTVLGNIYRCDKNNGNGLQVMANNFDYDSQLILSPEKNLLLYFKSGEMYSLDIITSAVSATGLKPGGFIECGVAVK